MESRVMLVKPSMNTPSGRPVSLTPVLTGEIGRLKSVMRCLTAATFTSAITRRISTETVSVEVLHERTSLIRIFSFSC